MLDCETPLGKIFIGEQHRIQKLLQGKGYEIINTSGLDNRSDILIAKDGTLCGVAEIRSRISAGKNALTIEYLRRNGGYLITNEKIAHGLQMSELLRVPFFVIVSLMVEDKVLIWKISDSGGKPLERLQVNTTKTRKTVNGGIAYRENAFLPMDSKNLTII